MRTPLPVLGAGLLALLGGCTDPAATARQPEPVVRVVKLPASAAGGACQLLGYPTIEKHLGVRFEVAVAREAGDAATCVVQTRGATLPDLVLSMSGPTGASAAVFRTELRPARAKAFGDLGRAAYWRALPVDGGVGRAVEVGWLSQDTRIITLRYHTAGSVRPPVAELGTRLTALARDVDRSYG